VKPELMNLTNHRKPQRSVPVGAKKKKISSGIQDLFDLERYETKIKSGMQ
jgi:hypothetical protein